jgi:uncharacterized protein YuzE
MVESIAGRGFRAEYDPEVDALYVYLGDRPYGYGRDLDEARRVDYSPDGTPRGLEFLSPKTVGVDLRDLSGVRGLPAIAKALSAMGFTVLAGVP